MTEPLTTGGRFLRDSLNASILRSVGSLEAALANVVHAKDAASAPNNDVDADGRLLND